MSEECCKKNFFESIADTAKRIVEDPTFAPQAIQQERLDICQDCEHRTSAGRCKLCGCILALKVKPNNARCPASKWTENPH